MTRATARASSQSAAARKGRAPRLYDSALRSWLTWRAAPLADLAAVDQVIGLFMPDFDPGKIKPVRPRLRHVTALARDVVAALRPAGRP